jgi:hypothetical protein
MFAFTQNHLTVGADLRAVGQASVPAIKNKESLLQLIVNVK